MKATPTAAQRRRGTRAGADALEILGIAPAAARILRYFLIRPGAHPHARELQRTLRLGGSSLQRELERLVRLGALARSEEGNRSRYRALDSSPVWQAVRLLAGAAGDPTRWIEDALLDVAGLRAVFLFGSIATGTQREDSDIDLFVVEDPTVDRTRLHAQLAEVAMLVGREVNAVRYTREALEERLGDPAHPARPFVREVLQGPKRWVAGNASELAPLMAAKIGLDTNAGAPA